MKEIINLEFGEPTLIKNVTKLHMPNTNILSNTVEYRFKDRSEQIISDWVRYFYKTKFGIEKKHVVLTNGTTGAIHILTSIFKDRTFSIDQHGFIWYKKIFEEENVKFVQSPHLGVNNTLNYSNMFLLDRPSNPHGHIEQKALSLIAPSNIIWDSVYASKAFINGKMDVPNSDYIVGSFSKILGMSGLRIGWLYTDDDDVALKAFNKGVAYTCGLSSASLDIAAQLTKVDFDKIQDECNKILNYKREEFQKLESIFGLPVPENGMFFVGLLGYGNKKYLDRAGVKGLELKSSDGEDIFRLNMADELEITKKAVKELIYYSGRPKRREE